MHDSTKIEIKIALHGKTTVFFLCCKTWHIYFFIYFFFLIRYLAAGCPTKRVWLARLLLVGEWKKSDCTVKYGNSKQEIKWIENSPSIIIYDRRGEYPKVKCVCVYSIIIRQKKLLDKQTSTMDVMCSYKKTQRKKNYEKNKKSDEKYLVFSKRINLVKKKREETGCLTWECSWKNVRTTPEKCFVPQQKKSPKWRFWLAALRA